MKREQHLSPLTLVVFFLILNREETASGTSTTELVTHIIAILFAISAVAYPRLRALRATRFHGKQIPLAVFLSNPSEINGMVQDIKKGTGILTSDAFMVIGSDGRLYSLSDRLGRRCTLIRIASASESDSTFCT